MKRFTALFDRLDRTTRTGVKVGALADYFADAPVDDAAWATAILTGQKLGRAVPGRVLRELLAERTDLPAWLIDACYSTVGDLSETVSLLAPAADRPADLSLSQVIDRFVEPLTRLDRDGQRRIVAEAWATFDRKQVFIFHKLISTSFRVGVSAKLAMRGIAQAADLHPATIAHRLAGRWVPTTDNYRALVDPNDTADDATRPYPFYLAHPYEAALDALGEIDDWQIEWKWDGIRGQVIHRGGQATIWSRGDEQVTDAFPEIARAAAMLPDGTVLDGELLAWDGDRPLPVAALQRRINRKRVEPTFWPDVPVAFMAYDLLEADGEDQRGAPLLEREQRLTDCLDAIDDPALRRSSPIDADGWADVRAAVDAARDRGTEGVMIKRRDSPYRVGRVRGEWWKLKADPYTIDAVMVAAQPGHGRRANLYTDYTFAVWDGDELATFTKAYSGLTDDEIARVNRWVRGHTTARHGPVRSVEPTLVFEIAFEGIAASNRYKSGIALRFPRIARWRHDKPAAEADRMETLRALLAESEARRA